MTIESIDNLLNEFYKIPIEESKKTLMEITRFPHYENINSNILHFFLNPQNEHGLGNLVLNSLLELLKTKLDSSKLSEVEIEKEVLTQNKKRIDLLIKTKGYCIGIENKIFHSLNNDFEEYSNEIDAISGQTNRIPIKILLSLLPIKREERLRIERNNFENILHLHLIEKIEENIGSHILQANSKYLIFLIDYMNTIRNLKNINMNNGKLWNYFDRNFDSIKVLNKKFDEYKSHQFSQVNNLKDRIVTPEGKIIQWIYNAYKDGYNGYCLVHDFAFKEDQKFALDIYFNHNGWEVAILSRKGSEKYFKKKFIDQTAYLTKYEKEVSKEYRIVLRKFEKNMQMNDLANIIKEILQELLEYIKS